MQTVAMGAETPEDAASEGTTAAGAHADAPASLRAPMPAKTIGCPGTDGAEADVGEPTRAVTTGDEGAGEGAVLSAGGCETAAA